MYPTRLAAQVIGTRECKTSFCSLKSGQSRKREGRGSEGIRFVSSLRRTREEAREVAAVFATASFHFIELLHRSRRYGEKKKNEKPAETEKPWAANMFLSRVLPSQTAQNDGRKKKEEGKTYYQNIKTGYTEKSTVASRIIGPASSKMRTKVAKSCKLVDFFQCFHPMPQILLSRTLHVWPFPLFKTHTHTVGQRKSSTTINQAAGGKRE